MFKNVKQSVGNFFAKCKKTVAVLAGGAITLLTMSNASATEVTLPETGVDVSAFITTSITALGGIVAVAIGGYAAFMLVKMGLKWLRRSLS